MEYPATAATTDVLPNGLTVILDPDPTAPVVSAQWWVETGSIHEDELLGSGVSHFLEHMVFKGTRDFSAEELADSVQAAGGHWNAYTSFDQTVYYIDGPSESLPLFLRCLSGMVYFPTLPESEFEREKDVIRREIDMGLDDPDNAAMRLMFSRAYQLDPRRHPVIGHKQHFDDISYADLTGYHRARYTTDRSFVVVSGDFDPEAVLKTIGELTAEAGCGKGREAWVPKDPAQLGARHGRDTFAVPDTHLSLAWKIPALEDPSTPAFEVLASLLGQGRSSRLYRTLREERGLAFEISAYAWNMTEREGLFVVSAHCDPKVREELIAAILGEIEKLATDDLGVESAKAKRLIAASQFRTLVTASGRASDLASNWHEARNLDFTRDHVAAVMAVTPEDLRNAALQLADRSLTTTILDPLDAPAVMTSKRKTSDTSGVETHQLSNGVTVAVFPDRRVPLVHLQAGVLGGLSSETAAQNGINQLMASCLPKGTASRSAQEIADALESLGASAAASAGNNSLQIQAAGLAPDFAKIANVWCEIIAAPEFPGDAVAREKASQTAAWRESLNEPLHSGFRALRKAVFAETGYGLDPLGDEETIAALERDTLLDHHRRQFLSQNSAVAVAGDVETSAVIDALESGLSNLQAGTRWVAPPSEIRRGQEVEVLLPKKQAVLCIGFPCAAAPDEGRHALGLLNEYASDMAGPLFTRIREELGLAYQVGATRFHGHDTGLFSFYMATSPDHIDLAREELMNEIAKIAESGIPDDTLDATRATMLSSLAIQQQSPAQLARQAAVDMLFGLPADHQRSLPDLVRSLSADEIREVAAQTFGQEGSVVVVLPDESA